MSNNILHFIIKLMGDAQKNKVDNKKDFVLTMLRNTMPIGDYQRYEPIISDCIDIIKYISRNKDILNDLKKINCFSCVS